MTESDQRLLDIAISKVAEAKGEGEGHGQRPNHKLNEYWGLSDNEDEDERERRINRVLDHTMKGFGKGILYGAGTGVVAGGLTGAALAHYLRVGDGQAMKNGVKNGILIATPIAIGMGARLGSAVGNHYGSVEHAHLEMADALEKYRNLAYWKGVPYARKQMEIDEWDARHTSPNNEGVTKMSRRLDTYMLKIAQEVLEADHMEKVAEFGMSNVRKEAQENEGYWQMRNMDESLMKIAQEIVDTDQLEKWASATGDDQYDPPSPGRHALIGAGIGGAALAGKSYSDMSKALAQPELIDVLKMHGIAGKAMKGSAVASGLAIGAAVGGKIGSMIGHSRKNSYQDKSMAEMRSKKASDTSYVLESLASYILGERG